MQEAEFEAPDADSMGALRDRQVDSLWYLSCRKDRPEQRVYDKVWRAQRAALQQFCRALDDVELEYLVFKGAEFVERFYRSRSINYLGDCDLLVRRPDIIAVQAVLYGDGFRPATFDPEQGKLVDRDVIDLAAMEGTHYELAPFKKLVTLELDEEELAFATQQQWDPLWVVDGIPLAVVNLDIHHQVASDIGSNDFFLRKVPSSLGFGATFSAADHLWFTTSRYYTEVSIHGKRSLRDLAYLVPLVASDTVDWDLVVDTANSYQLRPSLFYLLRFMDWVIGPVVPDGVLDELLPLRGSRVRDWGWQLGNIFDAIEPFPFGPRTSDPHTG